MNVRTVPVREHDGWEIDLYKPTMQQMLDFEESSSEEEAAGTPEWVYSVVRELVSEFRFQGSPVPVESVDYEVCLAAAFEARVGNRPKVPDWVTELMSQEATTGTPMDTI